VWLSVSMGLCACMSVVFVCVHKYACVCARECAPAGAGMNQLCLAFVLFL
jgi:hypothetical protein